MGTLVHFSLALFLLSSCNGTRNQSDSQSSNVSSSISEKKEIENLLKSYNADMLARNFEKLVSYVHPALLEKFSEAETIKSLKEALDNEIYEGTIDSVGTDELSKVVNHGEGKFALSKNTMEATYRLKKTSLYEEFCNDLKKDYQEVVCDKSKNTVKVKMKIETYIVYSSQHKRWFLIGDSSPQDVKRLIPESVRKELGIVLKE